MSRLRLASLLAIVLALSGASAVSMRPVESTRLVASVGWWKGARQESRARLRSPRPPQYAATAASFVRPADTSFRSTDRSYSLYQRPPPDRRRS